MTGLPGSEATVPALASSANPRTLGAAARAPTVAAPIAAPCRNFRRDILFLGSRAIRFPSVYGTAHPDHPILQREARPWRGYFVMCNSPCYNESEPVTSGLVWTELLQSLDRGYSCSPCLLEELQVGLHEIRAVRPQRGLSVPSDGALVLDQEGED